MVEIQALNGIFAPARSRQPTDSPPAAGLPDDSDLSRCLARALASQVCDTRAAPPRAATVTRPARPIRPGPLESRAAPPRTLERTGIVTVSSRSGVSPMALRSVGSGPLAAVRGPRPGASGLRLLGPGQRAGRSESAWRAPSGVCQRGSGASGGPKHVGNVPMHGPKPLACFLLTRGLVLHHDAPAHRAAPRPRRSARCASATETA